MGADLAEDVVAETFLLAHERRHSYDPAKGEPLPWLYEIATNVLRKHLRMELSGDEILFDPATGVAVGRRSVYDGTMRYESTWAQSIVNGL